VNDITTNSVPKAIEQKIFTAIELKKQLEQYEADIKNELLQAMSDNNITSIKNDLYTITLASRKSFKVHGNIPAGFSKPTLDSAKVSSHYKLYGELPKGIEVSTTEYITWRSNKKD
jgi:hypothetical protein